MHMSISLCFSNFVRHSKPIVTGGEHSKRMIILDFTSMHFPAQSMGGCLMTSLCLELQGCHWIPFFCFLLFCLIIWLFMSSPLSAISLFFLYFIYIYIYMCVFVFYLCQKFDEL